MSCKTISEIEQLIITQLEAQFNFKIPLLSKAFNRVLARVLAAVWIINYKYGSWIVLQLFVSTASFKEVTIYGKTITPLIEWGRLVGAGDPLPSTAARLSIDITVNSPGQSIRSGEQFVSSINGATYITDTSYTLVGPTDTIEIIATAEYIGTQGNLTADDPISLVNPLGIIDREAVVNSVVTNGTDGETEAEYRSRVSEKFKERPQGGALVDYRIWSSDVSGVGQTYWYTGDKPHDVIGYVAGDISIFPDRIPNSALLVAVGNACDFSQVNGSPYANRRPVTAVIDPAGDKSYSNINAISLVGFDIDVIDLFVDDPATVKASILSAVNAYMIEREPYIEGLSFPPVKSSVQQSEVIGLIQNIVTAANGTFLTATVSLNSVIVPNYVLQEGELSELLTLTYDGV